MRDNEIVFVINEQERIQIILPCKLDDIFRYQSVTARYVNSNSSEYVIYLSDFIIEFTDVLNTALSQALNGLTKLDESIKEDLGLLWNKRLDSVANDESSDAQPECVAQKSLLWSPGAVSSWLYEKDDKIFLEITPTYKWHFLDPKPEEREEYMSYEQFMKNYKPHVITELSRDTICAWLKQTRYLLALIEFNDDKYLIK